MAGVVPNEAERNVAKKLIAKSLFVRLFKNDISPGSVEILTSFTEANFPGYAAIQASG